MASISNSGKAVTIAFTTEEKAQLMDRGGEAWLWQIPEFTISEDGIGTIRLRADMFHGRKLGQMTNAAGDRWMLVIPSNKLPLAPYFSRVQAPLTFPPGADQTISEIVLPRELPPLTDKKAREAKLATAPKPRVKAVKAQSQQREPEPAPAAPSTALVVPQPQQRGTSNIAMLIEGKTFRFEAPIEDRVRLMAELSRFMVVKD
jgi:hypothetical protein